MGNINCYVKIYIKCDYSKRQEAKRMGCCWDANEKLWYYYFKEDTGTDYKNIRKMHAYELIKKGIFARFKVVKVKSYSDKHDETGEVVNKGFASIYYEKVCKRIYTFRNIKDEKLVKELCTFFVDWEKLNWGLELIMEKKERASRDGLKI